MRNWFAKASRIGISETEVTFLRENGAAVQESSRALGERGEMPTAMQLQAALGGLLDDDKLATLPARIVVADSWARFWMVVPPGNAASIADCESAAMARFMALFGDSPLEWEISADYDARQPYLACAIPRWLISTLKQISQERSLALLSVAPQFVVAWNAWCRKIGPDDWFGVMHENRMTYAVAGEKGPAAVGAVNLPPQAIADQERLHEILLRDALRLNVPAPQVLKLCGRVPLHWVMQQIGTLNFDRLDRIADEDKQASSGLMLARAGLQS